MIIVDILPSYWYNAIVIVTSCGHRHIRPRSMYIDLKIGDEWKCYCEDIIEE